MTGINWPDTITGIGIVVAAALFMVYLQRKDPAKGLGKPTSQHTSQNSSAFNLLTKVVENNTVAIQANTHAMQELREMVVKQCVQTDLKIEGLTNLIMSKNRDGK